MIALVKFLIVSMHIQVVVKREKFFSLLFNNDYDVFEMYNVTSILF